MTEESIKQGFEQADAEFEKFVSFVTTGVESVGSDFDKPDADWVSALFARNGNQITVGMLDPSYFSSPERKDFLAGFVIPAIIKGSQADAIALVNSVWAVRLNTEEARQKHLDSGNSPSESPDRVEMVTVHAIDASHQRFLTAEIVRDGINPPTLKPWDDDRKMNFTGRFADPIQEAFGHDAPDIPDEAQEFLR